MGKRVFIYAYANMNLGDDLFIKILCDRYPKTKFYIVCNIRVLKGLRKISNLRIIPSIPFIDRILHKIGIKWTLNENFKRQISKFCDVIVHIGGSVFQQPEDIDEEVTQYKKRMIKHRPYFIIGSNFGPFNNEKYYYSYKSIFENATDICFRDKYSFDLFSDLPNVRYAPDIVFNYKNNNGNNNNNNEKNQVVISVISLSNRKNLIAYESIYVQKIIEISREFAKRKYNVYLMGFCKNEGDNDMIKKLYSNLKNKEKNYVQYYIYSGDIEKALKIIKESKIIIATRFHAIILGWIFNKKVLPIIYNSKSLNIINDMKIKNLYANIEKFDKVDAKQVVSYLIDSVSIDISRQKELSRMQFKVIDKYLLEE